jgi:hypothetical protein
MPLLDSGALYSTFPSHHSPSFIPFSTFRLTCHAPDISTLPPVPNPHNTRNMITRESQPCLNMGRGAYDTTGVPKPPPKPKRR